MRALDLHVNDLRKLVRQHEFVAGVVRDLG